MANRRPVRRRGLMEALYLPAVFKGLGITARHVLKNLLAPDSMITIDYPEVRKPMATRFRGAHRLLRRADGKVRCVACMCCPTVCPAQCITIIAGEDPDDPAEKVPLVFQIDMLRCIYCGFCVEACPKDAIRMDTGIYEINAFTRQDMVHTKAYMLDLMDGAKADARDVYRADPSQKPAGYLVDEVRPDLEASPTLARGEDPHRV